MSATRRRHPLTVLAAAVGFGLLFLPLVAVAIQSVNANRTGLEWDGFSLRWYDELFGDEAVRRAAFHTLVLAIVSTAISTVLGTALALGLERFPRPKWLARWLDAAVDLPVVTPDILFAAALVIAFGLLRGVSSAFQPSLFTMILGHVTFQISFVTLIVRSRLSVMGPTLAEAASDLNATPFYAFRKVTFPLIRSAVAAGAVLAFTLSLDDFVISFFTKGPRSDTLPILIFASLRRGLSPKIHALSTLIVLLTVLLVFAFERSSRRAESRAKPGRLAVPGMALTFLALAAGLVWAGARGAQPKALQVLIYSEYIDPELLPQFEARTGHAVNLSLYEKSEEALAMLQYGGGESQYDVVVVANQFVPLLARLERIRPLDRSKLPGLSNLDPHFPATEYAVPYQWGTVGIMYDRQKFPELPRTWRVIFDSDDQVGTFLLLDEMRDMLGVTLKYLGHSANATSPEEVKAAADALLAAKKSRWSLGFEEGAGAKNRIAAGTVDLGVVWNGDAFRAIEEDEGGRLAYFVPEEGSVVWADQVVIPIAAPNPELAHRFIEFLLEPRAAAQLSNYNKYATPNKAAMAHVEPEDAENPVIYPPPEILDRCEYSEDLGPANRLHDEAWTAVKAR